MDEDQSSGRSIFGLSAVELGILVVLGIIICGLVGLIGNSFLSSRLSSGSSAAAENQTPRPTSTLVPTLTPEIFPFPWPTVEPLADWNKFEFAESKASLWLPNTFQGGDPIEYPEIVMMTVETYSNDQAFNESVEQVLTENPAITFFAFDTAITQGARIVFVIPEPISPDLILTMDAYLDELMENARKEGYRIVGREIIELDNFKAGRLVIEFKVPVGYEELSAYVKMAYYLVQVEDTMWNIAYRTGRDEFSDYLPVIETSINTFHLQP